MNLTIYRFEHSVKEGNRGIQFLDNVFIGVSIECPNKYNIPFKGRVLAGNYIALQTETGSHGLCWVLQNVPGREDVIINHVGNSARDFEGCTGLGRFPYHNFKGERGVSHTRSTCEQFWELTKHLDQLVVTIIDC